MILTDEKRKALIKKIDDAIDSPWWLEPYDQFIGQYGLKYLDDNYGAKIPAEFHDDINAVVDAYLNDDFESIVHTATPEFINSIVDIPGVDEDLEGKMIAYNVQTIFQFIKWYAEKQKK